MKTLRNHYLDLDGEIIFKIGVSRFAQQVGMGDTYSDICGSWIEGVYQWATHYLENVDEVSNDKYTGWICTIGDYEEQHEVKLYIPNWVLDTEVKDFKHAKNLFNKYLTRKY